MFNSQTKRKIVALFVYPEFPLFRVFWGGLVIESLFVYTIAQTRTIPAQSPFFTAQFASQNPHNFLFFPAPCQKACFSCLFAFCSQNQIEIDSFWLVFRHQQFDCWPRACNNAQRIFGRLETGYHFEIYQHSLPVIKHGCHDFLQSVSCSFMLVLLYLVMFKLISTFIQSTGMKISWGRYRY